MPSQQQQQHLRGHDPVIAGSSSALNALIKVKGQVMGHRCPTTFYYSVMRQKVF